MFRVRALSGPGQYLGACFRAKYWIASLREHTTPSGLNHVVERAACRLRICTVCHAEPENGDADSAGPQDDAPDLAGMELDVRERIYDMVRPLDWMEEAPEPPGADTALSCRCLTAAHQPFQ